MDNAGLHPPDVERSCSLRLYRASAPQALHHPGSRIHRTKGERAFADPAFALYLSEARVWSLLEAQIHRVVAATEDET
jgi:hypothetical protein